MSILILKHFNTKISSLPSFLFYVNISENLIKYINSKYQQKLRKTPTYNSYRSKRTRLYPDKIGVYKTIHTT